MEPYSLVGGMGKVVGRVGPGLRPQRPTPWPAHQLGRAGEVGFVDGRRKRKPNGYSLPSPQRVPTVVPSPPSRWAGRYGPSNVRAAGRVSVRSTASPTQSHQRRGSRGRNLLPRGFFPPFLPKKWGPGWASQSSCPFQQRGEKTLNASQPPTPYSRASARNFGSAR